MHGNQKGIEPFQIYHKENQFRLRFKRIINSNYKDQSLKVSDIAAALSMSERQLSRNTQRYYKASPTQYLRRYRIEKAQMLLFLGYRISDVAMEVGFSSLSYFSLNFKAEFGCSASTYFRRIRDELDKIYVRDTNSHFE